METKKAYGLVMALGTKLGERARNEPGVLATLRGAPDITVFRALVHELVGALLPPALVTTFCDEVLTDTDWVRWRARLLLQAKLVRDGGKPAPGHEKGKGVGGP
jgi:hypothetical protein